MLIWSEQNTKISDSELPNSHQSSMSKSTEEKDGSRHDSDFGRIEELIKGNSFSREEITHLMEILNSRVDNESEKQKTSNAVEDTQMVSWTPEIPRTPSEGQQQDNAFRENSDVPVGVSASPIDIARAYMAGRTSEGGRDFDNSMSNTERTQPNYEFTRKPPLLPSDSRRPSICWPGAMVPDRFCYSTPPQSQKQRHRLHDFPRTPYSRTLASKSTTKLQADNVHAKTSSPFQHSQTLLYGQVKSSIETVDTHGSAGPIRCIRNRFALEVRPRGSIFPSSSKETYKIATPQVFGGFLPSAEKKYELGEPSGESKYISGYNTSSSSDRGISNSTISSSQASRKILEYLDRNKPTPKEKEAELKLAMGWIRSSIEDANASNMENISSVHVEKLTSHKSADTAGTNLPVVSNKSSSKPKVLENFNGKGKDGMRDTVTGHTKASSSIFSGSKDISGANPMPLFGLTGTSGPVVKNLNENSFSTSNHRQSDTSSPFSRPHLSNGPDEKAFSGTTGSEIPKNHGAKPSLPSILINRPDLRADNGPGFTFPISASSGANSEPPTPSIMPSSSAGIADAPSAPSYTFGSRKSASSLIFSFPSTSSDSNCDASDLKFSFGSDDKTRLTFSSFDKDAICY